MLGHYRMEEEDRPDGSTWFWPTDEWVDDPCEWCGSESVRNGCSGDGRNHHHGRVHTREGGLSALCKMCAELDAAAWAAGRK